MALSRRSATWIAFAFVIVTYGGAQWIGRRDVALTDDAHNYLAAAETYKQWYFRAWTTIMRGGDNAFAQPVIDQYFQSNNVHPPVAKSLMAAGIAVFHDTLGWLDEIDAARTAVELMSTMTAGLMFLFCAPVYGLGVAIAAPLFLLVMPRFFFDSHVESLDVATAATYFASVFCFWHARRSSWWALAAAVVAGIAMATKINGALVVVPLAAAWMIEALSDGHTWHERVAALRRPPVALGLMLTTAPLVAIMLWPWLWADTLPRLAAYIGFYVHHHPTLFYYFGKIYDVQFAPWHAPFIMAAITTPTPILLCAVIGAGVAIARWFTRTTVPDDVNRMDLLVLLNLLCTIGAVALPNVPKYGGVKLFLPFFPFLAILAGIGFDRIVTALVSRLGDPERWRFAVTAAALVIVLSPMAVVLAGIHPYELSYYNALAGGLAGADRHGFEIQYYDLWYLDLVRWLNRTFPGGVKVFFEPNNLEYRRHVVWYYETGRLNRNVVIVPERSSADVIVLTHEKRWPTYAALNERFEHDPRLYQLVVDGVALLTVYDAHGAQQPPAHR